MPPPFSLLPLSISLLPFKSRKGPKGSPALGYPGRSQGSASVGRGMLSTARIHQPRPCPAAPRDPEGPVSCCPSLPETRRLLGEQQPSQPWGERPERWPCCTLAQRRARGQEKMQAGASRSMG